VVGISAHAIQDCCVLGGSMIASKTPPEASSFIRGSVNPASSSPFEVGGFRSCSFSSAGSCTFFQNIQQRNTSTWIPYTTAAIIGNKGKIRLQAASSLLIVHDNNPITIPTSAMPVKIIVRMNADKTICETFALDHSYVLNLRMRRVTVHPFTRIRITAAMMTRLPLMVFVSRLL